MKIFEVFFEGGAAMYLLLLCSIAVAAIAIERYVFFNYARQGKENFLQILPEKLKNLSADEAANFCYAEKSCFGKVAFSGVLAFIRGESNLINILAEAGGYALDF